MALTARSGAQLFLVPCSAYSTLASSVLDHLGKAVDNQMHGLSAGAPRMPYASCSQLMPSPGVHDFATSHPPLEHEPGLTSERLAELRKLYRPSNDAISLG